MSKSLRFRLRAAIFSWPMLASIIVGVFLLLWNQIYYWILYLWGDRIFEKCGIRRDEGGDGGKTLEIRGKRRLSARDGGANYQQS